MLTSMILHTFLCYFYPRPPRGGRPRRVLRRGSYTKDFYPRPPRGGRRYAACGRDGHTGISIHALREEGDVSSSIVQM